MLVCSVMSDATNRKALCDIARRCFAIANQQLEIDQKLSKQVRSEGSSSRQFVNEETITDLLVGDLLTRFPGRVKMELFTRAEENMNGADWYWRLEAGGRAIHARVQAKRVHRSEFGQEDSAGHVKINRVQLDKLVNVTHQDRCHIPGLQSWVVTFLRYEGNPPCGCDDLNGCERHQHGHSCDGHAPSVWVADAKEIYELGKSSLTARQIVEHSIRLDCMLPCIAGPRGGGPASKGFALQFGLPSFSECVATIRNASVSEPNSELKGALRIRL